MQAEHLEGGSRCCCVHREVAAILHGVSLSNVKKLAEQEFALQRLQGSILRDRGPIETRLHELKCSSATCRILVIRETYGAPSLVPRPVRRGDGT